MDYWLTLEITIITLLIVFSAFFSGSETAIISANRIRIKHLADSGNKNAVVLMEIIERPETFLTAVLIGNNIVNITASVLATDAALRTFGSSGIAIATGVMTLFILIFAEVLPKTLSSRHPESISMIIAKPIKIIITVLKPVIWILTETINLLITRLGGKERVNHPFVTEDKIEVMLKVGEKEGTIERHEREIIQNLFEFSDTKAIEIMTPLEKIVSIEESNTMDTALALINESGHSRIPVYEKKLDNIIGMIYAKDFLKFKDHELSRIRVYQILRPISIVKSSRKIYPILKDMQKEKMNISVVVDNNNKVIGLVSMEDILEELVGEIFDEYDVGTEN